MTAFDKVVGIVAALYLVLHAMYLGAKLAQPNDDPGLQMARVIGIFVVITIAMLLLVFTIGGGDR